MLIKNAHDMLKLPKPYFSFNPNKTHYMRKGVLPLPGCLVLQVFVIMRVEHQRSRSLVPDIMVS